MTATATILDKTMRRLLTSYKIMNNGLKCLGLMISLPHYQNFPPSPC